jgi:hypothetical protein
MKHIFVLLGDKNVVLRHITENYQSKSIDYTYKSINDFFSFVDLLMSGEVLKKEPRVLIHVPYISVKEYKEMLDKLEYFSKDKTFLKCNVDIVHKHMEILDWQLDIIEYLESDSNPTEPSNTYNIISSIDNGESEETMLQDMIENDPMMVHINRVGEYIIMVNRAYITQDYGYDEDAFSIPKSNDRDEIPSTVKDALETLLLNLSTIINEDLLRNSK